MGTETASITVKGPRTCILFVLSVEDSVIFVLSCFLPEMTFPGTFTFDAPTAWVASWPEVMMSVRTSSCEPTTWK